MANGLGYVWVIFGNRLGFVWVSRLNRYGFPRPPTQLANFLILLSFLVVLADFLVRTGGPPPVIGQREELHEDGPRLGLVATGKAPDEVGRDGLFVDVVPVQEQVVEAVLYHC